MKPKEVPITREQVYNAIQSKPAEADMREWLNQEVLIPAGLQDQAVDVADRDDISGGQIHLLDLIMMDLDSYGPPEN